MKKYILVSLILLFTLPGMALHSWESSFLDKEEIETDIKIYPNPCKKEKVTIDYNSKEITEIRLTNITGKQVLYKKYDFPASKVQVQLYDIPNGIYLIQIKTSDNKTTVKKLMVSKN